MGNKGLMDEWDTFVRSVGMVMLLGSEDSGGDAIGKWGWNLLVLMLEWSLGWRWDCLSLSKLRYLDTGDLGAPKKVGLKWCWDQREKSCVAKSVPQVVGNEMKLLIWNSKPRSFQDIKLCRSVVGVRRDIKLRTFSRWYRIFCFLLEIRNCARDMNMRYVPAVKLLSGNSFLFHLLVFREITRIQSDGLGWRWWGGGWMAGT